VAFLVTSGKDSSSDTASASPTAKVTIPAPPRPDEATQIACTKVLTRLPVSLAGLAPRSFDSSSGFVAAWGQPPITFRCGVAKPAVFGTPQAAQPVDVNGVLWQPDPRKTETVYTTLDRSVYIEVVVPAGQDQPLPLLADAISSLPALCTGTDAAGNPGKDLPICKAG